MESWIYRLYCTKSQDRDGDLLYVGISDSPSSRMGNHESQKWWWWLVDKVEWQRCSSRTEAESLESRAISNEWPLFNKAQSQICAWDRLRDIIYLLWAHQNNWRMHPVCPFCESGGHEEILAPDGPCDVFRRHSDDKLVLHFETGCDLHGSEMKWAVHVPALEFVAKFGQMPELELEALWREAAGSAPWENRLERMSTLLEQFESVLCLPSQHSIAAVAGVHHGR